MTMLPVSEARKTLPAVIEASATRAVTLQRRGVPVAVVVSPERYDALLEAEEELADIEAFDAALAEDEPTIPWEQVRVDLGWT